MTPLGVAAPHVPLRFATQDGFSSVVILLLRADGARKNYALECRPTINHEHSTNFATAHFESVYRDLYLRLPYQLLLRDSAIVACIRGDHS